MNAMSYGLQFLLVFLLAALASAKVTVQGFASRKLIRTGADNLWFNALLFTAIGIFMAVLFPMGEINSVIFAYASFVGFTSVVFQYCYATALRIGPVSLTVLINNFSVLVTTAFSVLFLKDSLYVTQIIAVVFLVLSMILTSRSGTDGKKATRLWLALSLVCMLISAAFGIGQKFFLRTPEAQQPGAQPTELALSYFLSAAAAFAICFVMALRGHKNGLGLKRPVLLYAGAVGLILCLYQRLNIYVMGQVEGSFHFPTFSGLQSLMMTLSGVLLFRDRLTWRQRWGVAFGILNVVLMNLRFGPV